MRISIFTLLSAAICGLVTSCIPPYPPNYDPTLQATDKPVAPQGEQTLTEAEKQLEQARQNLETPPTAPDSSFNELPTFDNQPVAPKPTGPKPYKYATKVPGKPGFVFNPWTKNQVDVRGIPSGTLVRDPYDDDQTHKFRVP